MSPVKKITIKSKPQSENKAREFPVSKDQVKLPRNSRWIREFRQHALGVFQNKPIPTISDEPWRRTDLRYFHPENYPILPALPERATTKTPTIAPYNAHTNLYAGGLVINNGYVQTSLDAEYAHKGVVLVDLRTAEQEHPEILERIAGRVIQPEEGKFASLAGAFGQTGMLLYVPEGVSLEKPIYSLISGHGSKISLVSHILIYLGRGASATCILEYSSKSSNHYSLAHTGLTEIILSPEAHLNFVEIQNWDLQTWNFTHEKARIEANANLSWFHAALGSKLTKNFSTVDLVGKGAGAQVTGFYFPTEAQHIDLDTQQNHLATFTTSNLLYKGVLSGKSRSVWQGMVFVAPGAVKSDGYQVNRNLILSPDARADTLPGLEIKADDVRCSHGATVGKIDEEQIFYLLSRGVTRQDAEQLVVEGYFDPILQKLPSETLQKNLKKVILNKLKAK